MRTDLFVWGVKPSPNFAGNIVAVSQTHICVADLSTKSAFRRLVAALNEEQSWFDAETTNTSGWSLAHYNDPKDVWRRAGQSKIVPVESVVKVSFRVDRGEDEVTINFLKRPQKQGRIRVSLANIVGLDSVGICQIAVSLVGAMHHVSAPNAEIELQASAAAKKVWEYTRGEPVNRLRRLSECHPDVGFSFANPNKPLPAIVEKQAQELPTDQEVLRALGSLDVPGEGKAHSNVGKTPEVVAEEPRESAAELLKRARDESQSRSRPWWKIWKR